MFTLEELQTEDGLLHQGLVAYPKKQSDTAIIFIHGLTSTFYGNRLFITALAKESIDAEFAFGAFNNRGHDMIVGIRKIDPRAEKGYSHVLGGGGYEVFEESSFDIDAAITFFVQKGYTRIFLVGHSTGANKVSFYAGNHDVKEIAGILLLCPMSDRLVSVLEKSQIQEKLTAMKKKVTTGVGDALETGVSFFPMTPKRFVSLFDSSTPEDQFDYGDEKPLLIDYAHIRKPLLVVFAGNDEHADRPIKEIQKIFDEKQHSDAYKSIIIRNALHNFVRQETEVAKTLVSWCKRM